MANAEMGYLAVVGAETGHAEAWQFLGVIQHQRGNHAEAVRLVAKAISINPKVASFHSNLGLAYRAQGKSDEAAACFEEAIRLKPDNPVPHNNLGVIRLEQGLPEEAIRCFQQAKRFGEKDPEAYCNLGKALREQGKLDQAVAQLEEALRLLREREEVGTRSALVADVQNQLGVALREQGKFEEAVQAFEEAISLRPEFTDALNSLGGAFAKLGRPQDAERPLRRALEIDPRFVPALSNLGIALLEQERLDEAADCLRQALSIRPDFAAALSNLGAVYLQQGEIDTAVACLENALRIQPDAIDAHWNRALAWLTQEKFAPGWLEYEWRWLRPEMKKRKIPRPLWDGEPLHGRKILLHAEQGLGDTLQFVRYARQVKELGGAVIVACQKPLVKLLERCFVGGLDRVVPQAPQMPAFDLHAPLMSLPSIFRTRLETLSGDGPYLRAAPELVETWRRRLAEGGEGSAAFRVGIAWQGNPKYRGDKQRSIPLRHFAPLGQIPGVRLISLQKGFGAEQLAELAASPLRIEALEALDEDAGAFMDTAAILSQLDLFLTSDSAIAHLAGALGVRTWLLLPWACDWRWFRDREDCPWYPSVRLFRQPTRGNWPEVFQRVVCELREALAGPCSR